MTQTTLQLSGWPSKGLKIRVNGWVLSIQWGAGNYCTNYHENITDEITPQHNCITRAGKPVLQVDRAEHLKRPQPDAEIAIWTDDAKKEWLTINGDTVVGRVPMHIVLRIIGYLAEKPRTRNALKRYVQRRLTEAEKQLVET